VPTALLDLTVLATGSRARGIGRYVADLALAMSRRLEDGSGALRLRGVERLSFLGPGRIADDVPAAVERLLSSPHENAHMHWAYHVRIALPRETRRARPDLLHTGHPEATPLGRLPCPRVTTAHDLIVLKFAERYASYKEGFRPGRERLDLRRFGRPEHIIAVSETTASDLVTQLGIPAGKISVVYNGVDLSRFSPEVAPRDSEARARQGLEGRNYLLYVGAGDWRKNPDGMFAALSRARRRAPGLDLCLAWAGRLNQENGQAVGELAVRHGVTRDVHMLGYVSDEDLGALNRGAVAQLFVSRSEGFGYPIVEAMASGCPVITSNRSSMAELAGDAALMVDPEEPDEIAEAIVALGESESERRRFRDRGAVRCRYFSLDRMADETLEVYRSVLRGRR